MALRLVLVIGLLFGSFAFSYEDETSALQMCREDCMAFTDPGWDLKSCLYNCELLFNPAGLAIQVSSCETYEEDCSRPDNDDSDDAYDERDDDNDDDEGSIGAWL